jgi:hypothetical protein
MMGHPKNGVISTPPRLVDCIYEACFSRMILTKQDIYTACTYLPNTY